MAEISGGELLARCLSAENIRFVFGLPCPEIDPLLAALDGHGIRFVPVRHESAGEPVLQVTAQDRPDLAPVVVPVPERGTPVVLQPAARIDLHDTKEIIGIFSVLSSGRLVLLQREPSMRLRPLSTPISANDEHKIHIRRRDGKSVTLSVRLAPEHVGRLEDLNWK